MGILGALAASAKIFSRRVIRRTELFRNIKEAVALHFENGSESPDIDILVVSELKVPHAPAAAG